MKKLTLSLAALSIASVAAYLPHDEAKLNQMKSQCAHQETQLNEKHKEIAEHREAISRTAATHDTLEKDSRQPLPEHEVNKARELEAKLRACEADRDRLLKDIARSREDIARESAAADVREKDVQGMPNATQAA